jgi:hypothetical protein
MTGTLQILIAAQTATQTALDALAIAQKLNGAIADMVTTNRGPTPEELTLANAVFNVEDAKLSAAIAAAKAEGR